MQIFSQFGATYIKVEENDEVEKIPVALGDRILYPGQYVSKLGHRKRSNFEMQDGWYLKYVGKLGKYLLFDVNASNTSNIYYAFAYINQNKLFVHTTRNAGFDICIETLEVFDEVPVKKVYQQLKFVD